MAHPGSPGQRAVKRVCVCMYMLLIFYRLMRYSKSFVKSLRFYLPHLHLVPP